MATIAKGVNLMILDLFYCSKKIKTQKISIDLRPELTRTSVKKTAEYIKMYSYVYATFHAQNN